VSAASKIALRFPAHQRASGVGSAQEPVNSPLGQDLALLLMQGWCAMFSVDLSSRDCGGHVVVALRGELDIADASDVAAALAVVVAREPQIIVDLAGLTFIDGSGVAALARGRELARLAGGELRLAAPQSRVLRMLGLTCMIDVLPVHASVDEAAGHTPRAAAPAATRPVPAAVA
jgi:anti-sigma B factor antagonist